MIIYRLTKEGKQILNDYLGINKGNINKFMKLIQENRLQDWLNKRLDIGSKDMGAKCGR